MATQGSALDKLQMLETLYRRGYQSDVIDRALDKLIALERERVQGELAELQARLRTFEAKYGMSSVDFQRRIHEGELGDRSDFFEWSAFYAMYQSAYQRLQELDAVPA